MPVYSYDGPILKLKSVEDIKQNIIQYLQQKVQDYNTKLAKENTHIATYNVTYRAGLARLAAVDRLAAPGGRQYNQLPTNIFVEALGDKISSIADILYLKNV